VKVEGLESAGLAERYARLLSGFEEAFPWLSLRYCEQSNCATPMQERRIFLVSPKFSPSQIDAQHEIDL
jgi:hypothetical protein